MHMARLAPENRVLASAAMCFLFARLISEAIMKKMEMIGRRFGRLVVLSEAPKMGRQYAWNCVCDCGRTKTTTGDRLRRMVAQSCGCLHSEVSSRIYSDLRKTHGMSRTPTHRSWMKMIERCHDQNHHAWHLYGGKGVTVCDRWRDGFENFIADMGERPEGFEIDRIDPDGDYTPENCRWLSRADNGRRAFENYRDKKRRGFVGYAYG